MIGLSWCWFKKYIIFNFSSSYYFLPGTNSEVRFKKIKSFPYNNVRVMYIKKGLHFLCGHCYRADIIKGME